MEVPVFRSQYPCSVTSDSLFSGRYITCVDLPADHERAILRGPLSKWRRRQAPGREREISKQGKAENGWRRTASTAIAFDTRLNGLAPTI